MFSKFDEYAQKIILNAKKEMKQLKHPYVGSEHLLLAILSDNSLNVTKKLNKCNVNYDVFRNELISVVGIGKKDNNWFLFTPLLKRIFESAILNKKNNEFVTVEDILISLLEEGEGVANRILFGMNIDVNYLYEYFNNNNVKYKNNLSKMLLDDFSINLNDSSTDPLYEPVVGRDKEINRIIEILLRKNKNNPLLIGDAGVGKTAIVEELARRIMLGCVPENLMNKKIYNISMASLIAGTKYRGEFEERINKIIKEILLVDNVILFIDEIHTLVGAGGAEGAIDAANLLKPYLARGKIKIIGATTYEEYNKFISEDKALDRRFQKVFINEPSIQETKNILTSLRPIYEKFHHVTISDFIIDSIVEYTNKYIKTNKQPDKSIDILDEVCVRSSLLNLDDFKVHEDLKFKLNDIKNKKNEAILVNDYKTALKLKEKQNIIENEVQNIKDYGRNFLHFTDVKIETVYDVIYDKTKIPVYLYNSCNYFDFNAKLNKIVVGQSHAIEKIFNCLKKTSLSKKNGPVSFLLVGKSGVGKTFFVKEFEKVLFNDNSLIKLNMNDFRDEYSINKVIGSPPGYSGYKDNNYFLNKIENNPCSIILLDEIEKAHYSVVNLFLQVLEEGYLMKPNGNKVDFSNCIIFMTSNLNINNNNLGFSKSPDSLNTLLTNFFDNKLVSKIDDIIIFNDLHIDNIRKIINNKILSLVSDVEVSNQLLTNFVDKIIDESNYLKLGASKIDNLVNKYISDILVINS